MPSTGREDLAEKLRVRFKPAEAALVLQALRAAEARAPAPDRPLKAAELLAEQHADAPVVAAVLFAWSEMPPSELEGAFDPTVASLTAELRRLESPSGAAAQRGAGCGELLRAAGADFRVLLARIALRVVELESRTDEPAELRALARETQQLLVPLADRLGLGLLRGRLEDACFRILEPDCYRSLERATAPIRKADDVCLALLTRKVAALVEEHGVKATVSGRAKSLWGLHRKMRARDLPVERVMDRLGLRVIVGAVPECYTVLGLLHTHFRPIPGTFDDYVALPKENGYQSLHTAVYPVREISAKPVEIQIRTRAMHEEAEFGMAAHWLYKSETDAHRARERQHVWLQGLAAQHEASDSEQEFVARLAHLVYDRSLLVFLRGGVQVRMPPGATARDVVDKVSGEPRQIVPVRVNAQPVSPDHVLRDGDTVDWDEPVPASLRADSGPVIWPASTGRAGQVEVAS
jgi:GTP pyrophosphokinase